jgi:mono/diheme cytochrome c family protein
MNDQEKRAYDEKYREAKSKGVPFFPDILLKDAIVVLLVFVVLVALAYFVGAPLEARADPGDTTYTPRPEWYFLFLFQLLKYFPGNLEVIGVILIPTLVVVLLFALPFLDRSPRRYFSSRPVVMIVVVVAVIGVAGLSIQSARETPPPAEATRGDPTAALYTANCASCHGTQITVPAGTNLHAVIAQGKHEGMPAWSADLTSDQIDALAGFILSPGGSTLFNEQCGTCHKGPEEVSGDPLKLKNVLEQGPDYPAHKDLAVPRWTEVLSQSQRTALLNFLVAPDGQRLFATNCSTCHGRAVAFSGDETQLRTLISQGGLHLDMPPWQEKLTTVQIDTLANYVVNPSSVPDGQTLFQQNCAKCHGDRVPKADDVAKARDTIARGGVHQTMPVWGTILTPQQIDALVSYTLDAAKGTPLELGQTLFAQNCASCHGGFGEGGPSPTRPGDVIPPISTAEFLKTRDDATLRSIIAQGQPNLGMSPFGSTNGGPLDDTSIDAIVAYIRSWEQKPPVEVPPEVPRPSAARTGKEIFADVCAQCHGPNGEGSIGPALTDPAFQANNTDDDIFNTISRGHTSTAMIAWGDVLSADQIKQLVAYIRQWKGAAAPQSKGVPIFAADVEPIFQMKCVVCHGALGGWNATSYDQVMNTGDHKPVVVPGDVDGSLLAQKILGKQTQGTIMPPSGSMSQEEIQIILDWIKAGAPEQSGATSSPAPTPAAAAPAKWSDFEPTLNLKCGTCHVNVQLGGLSFKTYADVLKGGKSGPAVVPGDPDKSVLVKVMRVGDHANVLSTQELEAIIAWIKAGAPEK